MQRCNFFRVGNRTCIVSYSHFRKLHLCTLVFLYLFFRRKITEIDRAVVIPSEEVVRLEPYPPQFLKFGTFPAPLQTMIEKKRIMILWRICTLIFVSGGKGGMPGLSHALVPAQESKRWSFGRLLLLPVIQKGLFLGPKKVKKN